MNISAISGNVKRARGGLALCGGLGLLALLALTLALPAAAQERFVEGVHYETLPQAVTTSDPNKVEVVEVFWYGCPHCFKLEPQVTQWLKNKPDNVTFVRMPAVLGQRWEMGARAYYVADKLNANVHEEIFDAIHVKKQPLNTPEQLAEFFQEHGFSQADFDQAYDSFDVQTNLRRSQELIRRYRLTGVPAFIVNGKYRTGSLEVVDFLVSKEASAS